MKSDAVVEGLDVIEDGGASLGEGAEAVMIDEFVVNATPVVRPNYRLGVPESGFYREIINTDAETYGGSNVAIMAAREAKIFRGWRASITCLFIYHRCPRLRLNSNAE